MNSFNSLNQLLGKYRYSSISNVELTRAILRTIKLDNEKNVQACGHSLGYSSNQNNDCIVCLTIRHTAIENAINSVDYPLTGLS